MKPFLFVVLSFVSFATMPVAADDATPSAASGPQAQKMERLKEALATLDLTDAQEAQIKQIRASTTDRKERRQQIMAVLTPDQKAKLLEMIKEHRNETQSGSTAPASGNGN